ncbi:Pro-corazonin [Frankliniella fusca]|uniref:Pro-corazonin n=1 Tax=Frankliniella fusca TaxID=407009 RepID=A0AAE1HH35_9NEOP|nr:Pro-corazonin [Frankliniella fusca]
MKGCCGFVVMLAVALASLLLADSAVAQTFSYSRGWKSGKRAVGAAGAALPSAGAAAAGLGGRVGPADDILAEDLPLYRYFLEGRGEHRVPYDPWRLVEDPLLHLVRRPALAQSGEQPGDHDDR